MSSLRFQLVKLENEVQTLRRRNSQLSLDAEHTQKSMSIHKRGYEVEHLGKFKKQYESAYKSLRKSKDEIADELEDSRRIVMSIL